MTALIGVKIVLTLNSYGEMSVYSFKSKKELIEYLLDRMDVSEVYQIKDSIIPKVLEENSRKRKKSKS